jgi:hypothetical protein
MFTRRTSEAADSAPRPTTGLAGRWTETLSRLAAALSQRTEALSRRTAALLMAGYVLVAALIVFWPTAAVAAGSVHGIWILDMVGLGWIPPSAIEFVTNTIMFMPLGYLGHTFKPQWGWRQWLLAGLAGTLTIELSQFLFLADRSAQLADVVSNTLGAVLGYALVTRLTNRPARDRRQDISR